MCRSWGDLVKQCDIEAKWKWGELRYNVVHVSIYRHYTAGSFRVLE